MEAATLALDLCWPVNAWLSPFPSARSDCSAPISSLERGQVVAEPSSLQLLLSSRAGARGQRSVLLVCLGSAPEQMVLPHTLARLRPHSLLLVRHMLR